MELYKSDNWEVIFVDWCQDFPGNCIISSKKESLSDLTNEEWIELGKIEKEFERIVKKLFNATMVNFACLMNNAYRDKETPNVHFHILKPKCLSLYFLFKITLSPSYLGIK